ncbi:toxin [Salmonella enterica]|nr:toxin [Salmonella enterica]EDX9202516.1 toxin [Salmonella enterica subsp. enterica serovar Miami]EEK4452963.1 toxin [Salmonella enterica]EFZ9270239.1 toxin [Salmonella enterica]EGC4982705.1 toxin [Salmonella enterica]
MKRVYCELMIILFLSLAGCSSTPPNVGNNEFDKIFPLPSGNGPIPPEPTEPGLAIPGPGPVAAHISQSFGANAPIPVPRDNPKVTIMSMSGAIITVWSRHRNSWLWGYTPWDSNSFGELRNWQIIPSKTPDTVRFVNQATGSCMTYGIGISGAGGFIHAPCNFKSNAFDFRLIPTFNGNVFIQSVAINRCIRARFLDRTSSSPYAYEILQANCPKAGEKNIELQWSISEPLTSALAAISKPEFKPFPPHPALDPDKTEVNTDNTHSVPANSFISYQ